MTGQERSNISPTRRAEDEADEEGNERRADGQADDADAAEEDEAADATPAGDGAAEEPLPDAAQPEEAAEPSGTGMFDGLEGLTSFSTYHRCRNRRLHAF